MDDTVSEGEVNAVAPETPEIGQADATETTQQPGYTAEELLAYWNQSKDRELSQIHRQYQGQMAQMKAQSIARMKQLGDTDADTWAQSSEIMDQAQKYQQMQSQQQAWQSWYRHVAETAQAHGLAHNDPRIQDARDSNELIGKARLAMREDAKNGAQAEANAARQERKVQLNKKMQNGQYDTMNGNPASSDQASEWKAAIAGLKRGDVHSYSALQREFRQRGFDV